MTTPPAPHHYAVHRVISGTIPPITRAQVLRDLVAVREMRHHMTNRPYRVIEHSKTSGLNVTVSSWHTKQDAERDASMRNIQLKEYTYRVVETTKATP
jgi:hypothetical protein